MKSRALLSSNIDHQVYKHNNLIESRYELNKIEQRLILLAIIVTRLNNKNGCLKENRVIEISVDDYMSTFDVDLDTAYHAMNDAIDSLYEKSFTPLSEMNNLSYDERPLYHWLGHKGKRLSQGVIEFSFSQKALEYIIDLESNFTHYSIANVKKFNCEYAAPLYELVIKMRNTVEKATRPYTVDEVRGLLGVSNTTHRDKNNPELTNIISLRRAVIERAITDINARSDIKVSYELFKTGRSITHIQFSFEFKTPEEMAIMTVADETKKTKRKPKTITAVEKPEATEEKKPEPKPKAKTKPTPEPVPAATTSDNADNPFLGTDITQEDLDNEKENKFAIDLSQARKLVSKQAEQSKPSQEQVSGPILQHQFDSYTKLGGTLSYEGLCQKFLASGKEKAAHFMLFELTELRKSQAVA